MPGGRLGDRALELALVLVKIGRRALVEAAAVALDRVAHRLVVGGEQERVEVPVGGIGPARGLAGGSCFLAPQPASASAAPPASSCLRVTPIGRP